MIRSAAFCTFLVATACAGPALSWQDETPKPAPIKYKSRHGLSAEDLRKQLLGVPEMGLDQNAAHNLYENIKPSPRKKVKEPVESLAPDVGGRFYHQLALNAGQPHLVALPWRIGTDSQIGKETAEELHVLSINLRGMIRQSVPKGDVRPDPSELKILLRTRSDGSGSKVRGNVANNPDDWIKPQAVPAMMQLLQAEGAPLRELLVELLDGIKGKEASQALANRALFDLSKEVREKAVTALAQRPVQEYKSFIVEGFKSPWPAAADHAADAAAALDKKELIAELVPLLKETNPALPLTEPKRGLYMLEFVKLNHMCNCMVCHAPSQNKEDLVRGRIPIPGEDPPPLYYAERTGQFVRADITYLRQDFSVVQPVDKPGKWPGNQRYDYFLRKRPVTPVEFKAFTKMQKDKKIPETFQQRESVLYALRALTRADAGSTFEAWDRMIEKK